MSGAVSAVVLARIVTAAFAVSLVSAVMIFKPGCVDVVMWASFEKSDVLSKVADMYEATRPTEDLRCVDITVVRKASGDAEKALTATPSSGGRGWPAVWSPAARSWLRVLDRHRALAGAAPIVPSSVGDLMQSPFVIAMPEAMARALGWPSADISWKDIFALARDPQGWATRGHPEWGRFKLGKTNPLISTSGLHALLATFEMSGGTTVEDPQTLAFMRSIENAVVHYGTTVSAFLLNLADADERGDALSYVSAIAMEEKQVWDYDNGNPEFKPKPTRQPPAVPLVAVYPSEGTFVADHPYAVMPWVDDTTRRAALHFLDYMKSAAIQKVFMDNAFRSADGATGDPINNSHELDRTKPTRLLASLDSTTVVQVQSSWATYRKRARVLVVLDTSASMGARVGAASASKLQLATMAWTSAIDGSVDGTFVTDDDVGLWTLAGRERHTLVDVGPLRDQRGQLRTELAGAQPGGQGKALYAAITDAVAYVRQRIARDRINAVVVLTDGSNDDPSNNDLTPLLRTLRAQNEDERVRVFTIALGPDADRDALQRIANASRGAYNGDATDPNAINGVIIDVVSNF